MSEGLEGRLKPHMSLEEAIQAVSEGDEVSARVLREIGQTVHQVFVGGAWVLDPETCLFQADELQFYGKKVGTLFDICGGGAGGPRAARTSLIKTAAVLCAAHEDLLSDRGNLREVIEKGMEAVSRGEPHKLDIEGLVRGVAEQSPEFEEVVRGFVPGARLRGPSPRSGG